MQVRRWYCRRWGGCNCLCSATPLALAAFRIAAEDLARRNIHTLGHGLSLGLGQARAAGHALRCRPRGRPPSPGRLANRRRATPSCGGATSTPTSWRRTWGPAQRSAQSQLGPRRAQLQVRADIQSGWASAEQLGGPPEPRRSIDCKATPVPRLETNRHLVEDQQNRRLWLSGPNSAGRRCTDATGKGARSHAPSSDWIHPT